jgi:uncharacterized membrane protein YraQ (UPF0718 family)
VKNQPSIVLFYLLWRMSMTLLTNFWQLFMVSAPWLLLGLFIAALLNVYLPKDFLNKHLGKEDGECFGMLVVPFKYFKK